MKRKKRAKNEKKRKRINLKTTENSLFHLDYTFQVTFLQGEGGIVLGGIDVGGLGT